MSFANPTPLRIGATGTLNGWRVRVAGRVVLGVRDGGETYYWNEYNLVDDQGEIAAQAPLALRASKRLLASLHGEGMWEGPALDRVGEEFDALARSEDAAEALAAFAAKRTPVWRSR